MNVTELKKLYGNEYPAALIRDGIRFPLSQERRFSRCYHSNEHRMGIEISRFMDGSASITAMQLQNEWSGWTDDIRMDFCQSSAWLQGQADFAEMLRFIMQHGNSDHWSGIALSVASQLPRQEAFDTLIRALRSMEPGRSSNIHQAIAETNHPDARTKLREHLEALWKHPALWNDSDFLNWIGFDATTCIAHLIEAGAPPLDFTEQVRKLSAHTCSNNRKSCSNILSEYYSWLR